MSRHRGAKRLRRYERSGVISLLSRSTFYLLSDGPSIRDRRITNADFRPCSRYRVRSQAPFYVYARCPIADRAEGTFALLRYLLGGDTPIKLPT